MLTIAHAALCRIDPSDRTRSELCDQIGALAKLESHLAERRLAVTAAIDGLDDCGVDGAGVNRTVGRCSGRRARQLAETAAALAEMPILCAALAAGDITAEHADAAARAAGEVDPQRADDELPSLAAALPADLFAKKAREWVGRNQEPVAAEEAYAGQRAARTARSWIDADGLACLLLRGDAVSMAEIDAAWTARINKLWHEDGGRDRNPDDIRSRDQRRYDALHDLICRPVGAGATPGRHPRNNMTVIAALSRLGDDPTDYAGIVDGEPLPQSVLERLACDAEITPILFGADGEVLWEGRGVRTATPAQWRALIARDRGCVLCGISPAMCEAHHLDPWVSIGQTDIDNLVLVCTRHHHEIHDTRSALVSTNGVWKMRPRAGPFTRAA